jgi:hypothetical protein
MFIGLFSGTEGWVKAGSPGHTLKTGETKMTVIFCKNKLNPRACK